MRGLAIGLLLLAGCRAHVQKALLNERPTPGHHQEVAANYQVGCPDVIRINLASLPFSRSYRQAVTPDGRVDLGPLGQPRVEGKTTAEIAVEVARLARVPPANVTVGIVEYKSKQVYIFGQVTGLQRAVAFQGPETVLDLLQRAGGLSAGAEVDEVYVVRSNVAEGGRPEVFNVELKDIVIKNDQRSNVRLEPFDQVYVGETRRSRLQKTVPPWLRPIFEWMSGLRRPRGNQPQKPDPLSTIPANQHPVAF
jgi:protein involved in polysaccharide export with SLBB domain